MLLPSAHIDDSCVYRATNVPSSCLCRGIITSLGRTLSNSLLPGEPLDRPCLPFLSRLRLLPGPVASFCSFLHLLLVGGFYLGCQLLGRSVSGRQPPCRPPSRGRSTLRASLSSGQWTFCTLGGNHHSEEENPVRPSSRAIEPTGPLFCRPRLLLPRLARSEATGSPQRQGGAGRRFRSTVSRTAEGAARRSRSGQLLRRAAERQGREKKRKESGTAGG